MRPDVTNFYQWPMCPPVTRCNQSDNISPQVNRGHFPLVQDLALSSRNRSLIVSICHFQVAPSPTRRRYTRLGSGGRRRGRARQRVLPVRRPLPPPQRRKITCRSIRNKGGTSLSIEIRLGNDSRPGRLHDFEIIIDFKILVGIVLSRP